METKNNQLKSSLKTRHVVMMSLGGAIGSGLFLGSGKAIAEAGPAVLISYILAGLILFVVMYGVGQMVMHQQNSHEAGLSGIISPYVGKHMAHFTDWVYWSLWMAALLAEEAGVSTFLVQLIPGVPLWVFALIVAVVGTLINLYSVRAFAETEYWLAMLKIAVIIVLIVVGLLLLGKAVFHVGFAPALGQITSHTSFAPHGFQGIIDSLLIVIFSFGGSELAAVTVAETENAQQAIPKAISGVLFRIISFYVIPIFLFLELLPWSEVSNPNAPSPFATLFTKIGIPNADKVILIVVIIAVFSAVNSAIYATSRSLYSRVQHSQGKLGQSLSHLSRKQVPVRAILVSSAVLFLGVILSAIFGDGFWQFIAGSISYTISIVWLILLVAAAIMYFKKPETGNWFIKFVTVIVLAVLLFIFISQITTNSWQISIFALIICLASFFSYRKK